ncbi:MAG: hypothetical protein QOK05_1373 [Chloroflexota bacterium]|nr:hypothetical protein [Chloroflexota bacterium]
MQKAGTSWWFALITEHPDVVDPTPRPKEVHFFDGFWQKPMDALEPDAYARYFPRPSGLISGECTPRYMFDYWVPPLLKLAAPRTRILVLLRDPLERYRSGVSHDLRLNRIPLPHVADIAAARGLYHAQLTNLLRSFSRDQVLLLQYERCVREPRQQLSRTLAFLGLSDESGSINIDRQVNVTPGEKAGLEAARERALLDYYDEDTRRLIDAYRDDIDPALWRTCHLLGIQ